MLKQYFKKKIGSEIPIRIMREDSGSFYEIGRDYIIEILGVEGNQIMAEVSAFSVIRGSESAGKYNFGEVIVAISELSKKDTILSIIKKADPLGYEEFKVEENYYSNYRGAKKMK